MFVLRQDQSEGEERPLRRHDSSVSQFSYVKRLKESMKSNSKLLKYQSLMHQEITIAKSSMAGSN